RSKALSRRSDRLDGSRLPGRSSIVGEEDRFAESHRCAGAVWVVGADQLRCVVEDIARNQWLRADVLAEAASGARAEDRYFAGIRDRPRLPAVSGMRYRQAAEKSLGFGVENEVVPHVVEVAGAWTSDQRVLVCRVERRIPRRWNRLGRGPCLAAVRRAGHRNQEVESAAL